MAFVWQRGSFCGFRERSLTMPRHWLRLVTWVSLAAFLLTNTPGALVAAAHLLGRPRHGHTCQHGCCQSCGHEATPGPGCGTEETAPCTIAGADSESHIPALVQAAASQERDGSPCQSCPCSNGGCAHCSVTKVPCCFSGQALLAPALCLGHLAEVPPLCPQPYCGELIRPPIA